MLHTLAGCLTAGGEITGNIYINNKQVVGSLLLFGRCGLMMQEDLLLSDLTVGELFEMAASLQLKNLPKEERRERIDNALEFLSIKHLVDRKIGREDQNFLSGGQRRRITLGIEGLLSHHKILFLDEPTTGLSANDAAQLIELLQRLAKEREITIIFSLHQPRAQVFLNSIDKLLLLHKGETAFFGSPRDVERYFAEANYPLKKRDYVNPADLMMDNMADSNISKSIIDFWKKSEDKKFLEDDLKENEESQNLTPRGEETPDEVEKFTFSRLFRDSYQNVRNIFVETFILLQFCFRLLTRRHHVTLLVILIEFAYSIVKGLVFIDVIDRTDYITDRFSSVFRALDPGLKLGFSIFYMELFPTLDRDLLVGRYGPVSYSVMWIFFILIRAVLVGVVNILVYYWIAGLQPIFSHYLVFLASAVLYKMFTYGLLLAVTALSGNLLLVSFVCVVFESIFYINSGFYVPKELIFVPLRWINSISLYYYANEGRSFVDIKSRIFECGGNTDDCPLTGNEFLLSIGYLDRLSLDYSICLLYAIIPIVIFCLYIIIFRVYFRQIRAHQIYSNKVLDDLDQPNDEDSPFVNKNEKVSIAQVLEESSSSDDEDEDDEEIDEEEFIQNFNARAFNKDKQDKGPGNEKKKVIPPMLKKKPMKKSKKRSAGESSDSLKSSTSSQKRSLGQSIKSILKSSEDKKSQNMKGSLVHSRMKKILSSSQQKRQRSFIEETQKSFQITNNEELREVISILPNSSLLVENIRFEVPKTSNLFTNIIPCDFGEKKILLHDICASFAPGTITAIMGPSGSGKSTFLQSICGYYRLSDNRKLYGDIFIEKEQIKSSCNPINVLSFMEQYAENFLLPFLTVRQTLEFAAQFQLPYQIDWNQKTTLINTLMDVLRLTEIEDNVLGPLQMRGVSGGQLRRIALAVEIILRRSKLVLLDEPTSGLSASGAAEVVSSLQSLAHLLDYTIILTIHQPRTEILNIFSKIIVLSKGFVVYNGGPEQIAGYFESLGLQLPLNESIADSFIDEVVADENSFQPNFDERKENSTSDIENEEKQMMIVKDENERKLVKNYAKEIIEKPDESESDKKSFIYKELRSPWYLPIYLQICILLEREMAVFLKMPMKKIDYILVCAACGVICGVFFVRTIDHTAENVDYLIAASVLSENFWLFLNSIKIQSYFFEKAIIRHELVSRRYHPFASYFVHTLLCLISTMIGGICYSSITFWMIGFNDTFWSYIIFVLSYIMTGFTIIIVVNILVYACEVLDNISNMIAIFLYSFCIDFSGFICHLDHIPVWIRWLSWLSPQRYLNETTMYAFLVGNSYECVDGESSFLVPSCPAKGGEFMEVYGYSQNPLLRNCLICFSANALLIVIGYFVFLHGVSSSWKLRKPKAE